MAALGAAEHAARAPWLEAARDPESKVVGRFTLGFPPTGDRLALAERIQYMIGGLPEVPLPAQYRGQAAFETAEPLVLVELPLDSVTLPAAVSAALPPSSAQRTFILAVTDMSAMQPDKKSGEVVVNLSHHAWAFPSGVVQAGKRNDGWIQMGAFSFQGSSVRAPRLGGATRAPFQALGRVKVAIHPQKGVAGKMGAMCCSPNNVRVACDHDGNGVHFVWTVADLVAAKSSPGKGKAGRQSVGSGAAVEEGEQDGETLGGGEEEEEEEEEEGMGEAASPQHEKRGCVTLQVMVGGYGQLEALAAVQQAVLASETLTDLVPGLSGSLGRAGEHIARALCAEHLHPSGEVGCRALDELPATDPLQPDPPAKKRNARGGRGGGRAHGAQQGRGGRGKNRGGRPPGPGAGTGLPRPFPSPPFGGAPQSWPGLVGLSFADAAAHIRSERPELKIVEVPQGAIVTMDHRLDRVRITVDHDRRVVRAPKTG
eukprot:CAMPEP_0118962324 /NCGR_PEP_ID=MMETSP1173-20130426/703_1 /TAXON_ID=1034831 /ORGANISM="Rhizochromulina marina cf, Strain CCMP1243" /LENGTH=483 /DNA_ID=CAMNT_0006910573 /DNA_START=79 /DNA_END=1530 /DNA_ORIENTATION=-